MPPTSETLGPYRLGDRLGQGGMGDVYHAYDDRLGRAVAIKRIRPDKVGGDAAQDAERMRRFRLEARAAAGLDHPAIVQIHDILESTHGDAIVMELVPGLTLDQYRREEPLSLAKTIDILRQISAGLGAAHSQDLVHRDLKAENIMLRPDGRIKILDFGIVALQSSRPPGHKEGPIGTLRAMSPEQARSLAVDARSDLFSLGVLAYELIANRSPFLAENPRQTLSNVCVLRQASLHEVVENVPGSLSRLVDRLLEKNPARRPASALEVEAELEAIAAASPQAQVKAPTLPSGSRASRPVAANATTQFSRPPRPQTSRLWRIPVAGSFRRVSFMVLIGLGLSLLALSSFRPLFAPQALESGKTDQGRPESRALLGESTDPSAAATPLYIAVAQPRIEPGAKLEDSDLFTASVRVALQRALVSLVGIAPLTAEAIDALTGTPLERARALGVAELVTTDVKCLPEVCHLTISRVRPQDRSVIWTRGLSVPSDEWGLAARAVESHLRQAFPGHTRRPDFPELEVESDDYAEYQRLRLAHRERRLPPDVLLERLAALRRHSPAFLETLLLEAFVLRQRFLSHREPSDLQQATELLATARDLAPSDPRPLATLFEVQLSASRPQEAKRTLAALERLAPASPAVLVGHARLHELRGQSDLALGAMRRAVRHQPSRPWLHRLAEMEMRSGETEAARTTLDALLARFPGDEPGLSLLAQLELLAGSVERSAELFQRLNAEHQDFARLTNLGVARLLLGQPNEAAKSFRAALDLEPENAYARLNLADALLLIGEVEAASRLYARVIEVLDATSAKDDWQAQTVRAQALAHLGRHDEAEEAARRGLDLAPSHPQAVLEASLVRALLGDRDGALELAQRALDLGVEPRWLELPWFDEIEPIGALAQRRKQTS